MLKSFKLYAMLLTLCMGSLAASYNAVPGQWQVSGEFIYFMPSVDDTFFVINGGDGGQPDGKRLNNDFEFEPGFRVGAGYTFCDCSKQILFSYTYLKAKQSRTVFGDDLYATVGKPDLVSNFEDFEGRARSDLDLFYQRYDLVVSQHLASLCGCGFDFDVLFGVEAAYIRFDQDLDYRNFESEIDDAQVHERSRTWAIGPQIGLAVNYELYQNTCGCPGTLSLNVLTSGSLLAAETKSRQFDVLDGDDILSVSDETSWRVIPAFHTSVGLNYDFTISCFDASFEIGYEFSSYIRALSRLGFPDDTADGLAYTHFNNFDLQGLYISAAVKF